MIEKGAHADLILFDGDRMDELNVIGSFKGRMDVIMKAGTVVESPPRAGHDPCA